MNKNTKYLSHNADNKRGSFMAKLLGDNTEPTVPKTSNF